MYLIRRVWKIKKGVPRAARTAADIVTKMGKLYEEAGQRSPFRVYTSGGTVPGPDNTVYMDWTDQTLRSPYRADNQIPDGMADLGKELNEFVEESYIEFYEMYSPS